MGDDRHEQHLAEADLLIARSMDVVAKQRALVERLEKEGADVSEARKLLRVFEATLNLMLAHRDLILRARR